MAIVTTRAIFFVFIAFFFHTALCIVGCMIANFYTGLRIVVRCTEFFPTEKAPRATASSANDKFSLGSQATREYIIACIIFETPPLTPRALLCILRHLYLERQFISV